MGAPYRTEGQVPPKPPIRGAFDSGHNPPAGAESVGLWGTGTITYDSTQLVLRCKRTRKWPTLLLGIVGGAAGILGVAGIAALLEDAGLELIHTRKGPGAVGMVGLLAMIGGYMALSSVGAAIFTHKMTVTIAEESLEKLVLLQDGRLRIDWRQGSKGRTVRFSPSEADRDLLEELLASRD